MKLARMTEEVFWSRFEDGPNGCRNWTGNVDAYGYGAIRWRARYGSRVGKVHRAVWELTKGTIPEGFGVLHTCDNPRCGAIGHLFLGTQADNQRDMSRKGRNHNSLKTHCPRGHEYTPENTIIAKSNGARNCRICSYAAFARYRHRKRGVA